MRSPNHGHGWKRAVPVLASRNLPSSHFDKGFSGSRGCLERLVQCHNEFGCPVATLGFLFCTHRSDIHEEGSVKIGARRARDFPDIHSASSAAAQRHECVCGCSHSHRRRRNAPCRTSGCNLSPALDLDVEPHFAGGLLVPFRTACRSSLGEPVMRQLRFADCHGRRLAV